MSYEIFPRVIRAAPPPITEFKDITLSHSQLAAIQQKMADALDIDYSGLSSIVPVLLFGLNDIGAPQLLKIDDERRLIVHQAAATAVKEETATGATSITVTFTKDVRVVGARSKKEGADGAAQIAIKDASAGTWMILASDEGVGSVVYPFNRLLDATSYGVITTGMIIPKTWGLWLYHSTDVKYSYVVEEIS